MNRIIVFAVACLMAATAHGYEVNVGTNSAVILPARSMYASYSAWDATNEYANGQYATIGTVQYMCLVGGLSGTNVPTAGPRIIQDGTITWVRVASGAERRFCIVRKVSGSTAVMLEFGRNATTNSGFVMSFNGAGITLDSVDAYNGEISAVSADGTNTLIVGEN